MLVHKIQKKSWKGVVFPKNRLKSVIELTVRYEMRDDKRRLVVLRKVKCLGLILCLLLGCQPQLVMKVETQGIILSEYPSGARLVEIQVDENTNLHGIYVPADKGAPLVICFQATGRSVAPPKQDDVYIGLSPLTRHLQGLGLSTLVFDYRGVGISTGSRNSEKLLDDSRAIWKEAMSFVVDRPERVVLRGTSLGSLALAALIADGVQPASAVVISPIRGETVVRNAGTVKFGRWLTKIAVSFLKEVTKIDIVDALAAAATQILVIASPNDAFLLKDEQDMLRRAIRGKGTWVNSNRSLGRNSDPYFAHVIVAAMNERIPNPHEVSLYQDSFRLELRTAQRVSALLEGVPMNQREALSDREWKERMRRVAARFHPNSASLASALALEGPPHPIEEYTSWLYNLPPNVAEDLPFHLAQYLVNLDDPSGELRLDWLTQMSILFSVYKRRMLPIEVLEVYRQYENSRSPKLPRQTRSVADEILHEKLLEIQTILSQNGELSSMDRRRILLRLLAKANGIPDQLIADSMTEIDLWIRGEWTRVDL